jgi:septal ring-binding cell division protein DamX
MSTKDPKGKKPKDSYSEQEQWEDDLDLPPIDHTTAKAKKPILEKAEFDKKRKKPIKLLFLILVILLTTGLFVMLHQSMKHTIVPVENIENEQNGAEAAAEQLTANIEKYTEAKHSDELWSEDTVILEEITRTELFQEEQYEDQAPQNYHIIIGSFKNENNATSWLEKSFFEEYGVPTIRKYEGWYRVIFLSYASVEQAEIEIDSIRNNLNLKAWIAYMK